ncbi:MAG: DoxX family membrane protein, partial [Candidatus Cybelea sp.]
MFDLTHFTDYGLLFLRVMAAAVYIASGYDDLKDPEARSKSLGVSKSFAIFLGAAEVAGGAAIVLGV